MLRCSMSLFCFDSNWALDSARWGFLINTNYERPICCSGERRRASLEQLAQEKYNCQSGRVYLTRTEYFLRAYFFLANGLCIG